MSRFNTCRFCKKTALDQWLVKYVTRHYAHPSCYLAAGKLLSDLPVYEQRTFNEKHNDEAELQARKGKE